MKLIIDISNNEYKQNKYYYDNVHHTIPLVSVINDIEHLACRMYEHKLMLDREEVLELFDKYMRGNE